MLDLVEPRFFGLDTSHLGGLLKSLQENSTRAIAARRLRQLFEGGWIPVIGFHQIQELLAHDDERLAIARLSALRHVLPLATIGEMGTEHAPGSIIEVQREEILAAVHRPAQEAQAVRRCVRASVLRMTTGDAVVEAIMPVASVIRQHTLAKQSRTRATSSISQAAVLDQDNTPFDLNGTARTVPEVAASLVALRQALAGELAARGDQRLADPTAVAKDFVDDLAFHTEAIAASANPAVEILKLFDLTAEDVEGFKTLGPVCDLAHFRRNISIAARGTDLSPAELRGLSQEQVPTWVIQRALRRYRALAAEARGGDLTDGYLLALAPYFDMTFVDKRTLENVRRIRQHDPIAGELLGEVRKASSWSKALDLLLDT